MSPEERQLIAGLFERMRRFGSPEKDRDAEALIGQQIRALPDASYMLVQSVLVQEQALENAQTRIQELQERVQQLEGSGEPPRKSGGFLGGYWGRRDEPREDARPSSVPQVGAQSRQPWSQAEAPPAQGAPAGGGFMRSAISTAAGVAGGVLLADSLRSMLGGHGGSAWGGSPFGASTQQHSADQAAQDAADDAAQDSADDAAQDSADDAAQDAEDDAAQDTADDAAEDAADDDDYGDDSGGDDMDI
jgi:uncharacterized protein